VVRSGQAVFLAMICIGTLLMGSAIIPLSIDDENSQRAADIACMCSPWLINIGFTISFSALFAKTWRLNKILLSKNGLRRVKVKEKDVSTLYCISRCSGGYSSSCTASCTNSHIAFPFCRNSGYLAIGSSPDAQHSHLDLLDCNCSSQVRTHTRSRHGSLEPLYWKLWPMPKHFGSSRQLYSLHGCHCRRQHYSSGGCQLSGLSGSQCPDGIQ